MGITDLKWLLQNSKGRCILKIQLLVELRIVALVQKIIKDKWPIFHKNSTIPLTKSVFKKKLNTKNYRSVFMTINALLSQQLE